MIDDELKWTVHIDHVCKSIIKSTNIFYKLRTFVPVRTYYRTLYYAFVYPHLLYGVELYANTVIPAAHILIN
jgi:hypothetical protein